ncbi:MAG: Uma2 family endonuclease [Bryobacteraceae bacterium]|nr:Uma2 family endonuclease [Bryobacteraceae bacterium]
MRTVALPETDLPAKLTLHPERRMSTDEFFDFCVANPNVRFELTSQGEIIIVPPSGGESSAQNLSAAAQLYFWAMQSGRGKAFDSSGGFVLASGAVYAPDAAWVSKAAIERLPKAGREKFLTLAPEFVIEVMSPSDRLSAMKAKMREWLDNGVQLGWLIDGAARTVYVFRPGAEPEVKTRIRKLAGDGPVKGFVLDLTDIWAGL